MNYVTALLLTTSIFLHFIFICIKDYLIMNYFCEKHIQEAKLVQSDTHHYSKTKISVVSLSPAIRHHVCLDGIRRVYQLNDSRF